METLTLKIDGMTCMGCVGSVKRVLQGMSGVLGVDVTLDPGQAVVRFDASLVDAAKLTHAVEDAGYEVSA